MWSGPRNISSALMRSWGSRPDSFVCDEPFYAAYLKITGLDHPGAADVIAGHETDWRKVVAYILGDVPEGKAIFYQKHMAHHMLPEIDRGWIDSVSNCFLIRDPREMLTSLIKNIPHPRLEDTGLPQQIEIFEQVARRTGWTPPVLDARDVLTNPRRMMELLCEALEVEFSGAMLSWPAGPRATDGVWAKYWYEALERSTGFEPYKPKADVLPEALAPLHARCRECYNFLYACRLGA